MEIKDYDAICPSCGLKLKEDPKRFCKDIAGHLLVILRNEQQERENIKVTIEKVLDKLDSIDGDIKSVSQELAQLLE
jgi:hypothetical protein